MLKKTSIFYQQIIKKKKKKDNIPMRLPKLNINELTIFNDIFRSFDR